MKKIGIISDTHGFWDDKYEEYFGGCDEIWHAGDIGSMELADRFEAMRPTFRAVYGNIDDYDMRAHYPEILRFKCEDVDVMIKHIGGYPGRYDRSVASIIRNDPPSAVHLRPLTHTESQIRPDARPPTHQSRSSWHQRMAEGAHPCASDY